MPQLSFTISYPTCSESTPRFFFPVFLSLLGSPAYSLLPNCLLFSFLLSQSEDTLETYLYSVSKYSAIDDTLFLSLKKGTGCLLICVWMKMIQQAFCFIS